MEWEDQEVQSLLANVMSAVKTHTKKSFQASIKNIQWEKVKVDGHTAEECEKYFIRVTSKVRRFRTMAEIITDAKVMLKDPTQLADYPKKPRSAYALFVAKKSKKLYKKKMDFKDVVKTLSEKWKQMDESEKDVYVKKAQELTKQYRETMENFKKKHSDLFVEKPKPPFPCNVFAESRVNKILEKHPELSYPDGFRKGTKKYQKLKDSKKLKWIERAIDGVEDYQERCRVYQEKKPEETFRPVTKILSKEEQKLLDESRGKPAPVPSNLYQYYLSTNQELNELTQEERKAKFKELSDEVREKLKAQHSIIRKDYEEKYRDWWGSLAVSEQMKTKKPREVNGLKKQPVTKKPKLEIDVNQLTTNQEEVMSNEGKPASTPKTPKKRKRDLQNDAEESPLKKASS